MWPERKTMTKNILIDLEVKGQRHMNVRDTSSIGDRLMCQI